MGCASSITKDQPQQKHPIIKTEIIRPGSTLMYIDGPRIPEIEDMSHFSIKENDTNDQKDKDNSLNEIKDVLSHQYDLSVAKQSEKSQNLIDGQFTPAPSNNNSIFMDEKNDISMEPGNPLSRRSTPKPYSKLPPINNTKDTLGQRTAQKPKNRPRKSSLFRINSPSQEHTKVVITCKKRTSKNPKNSHRKGTGKHLFTYCYQKPRKDIRKQLMEALESKKKVKQVKRPTKKRGTIYNNPKNLLAAPIYLLNDSSNDESRESGALGKSLDRCSSKPGQKKTMNQKMRHYYKTRAKGSTNLNETVSGIYAHGPGVVDVSGDIDDSVMNYSSYLIPHDVSYYGSNNEASVKHSSCVSNLVNEAGKPLINQYKLMSGIGMGSFGKVYKVKNTDDNSIYALKTLKKNRMKLKVSLSLGSANGYDVLNEINIIKKMSHPSIVRLHEVIEDQKGDRVHLVMDYVRKGSVMSSRYWQYEKKNGNPVLEEDGVKRLDLEVTRKYFRQLVLGMDYLHNVLEVVHRDIKPGNILIDEEDNVKLSDFGVSEMMDSSKKTNRKMGTRQYLPPEVFSQDLVTAGAIDIWGMGITLFYFLHGKLPFESGDAIEFKQIVTNNEPSYRESIPKIAIATIKKCLDKDPERRVTIQGLLIDPWLTNSGEQPLENRHIKSREDEEEESLNQEEVVLFGRNNEFADI